MASVMAGLLPETTGIQFTSRPMLKPQEPAAARTARNGLSSSLTPVPDQGEVAPNASLSSIEIEAMLREKVRAKSDGIVQAFRTYDVDQTSSVTKGEFRRAIEAFCTHLTTDQFEAVLAKVEKNPNGTVRYNDFMDKFYGRTTPVTGRKPGEKRNGLQRFAPSTPREINVDIIEKQLKEKIEQNLKTVVKGLQLFDYNRDGRIQRHEMRRVIENYCFRLSDQQFDKLWQRYDFHHTGLVNYKEFLEKLGISVQNRAKPPADGTLAAMNWQQNKPNPHLRNFKQRRNEELALQALNFQQIEMEFRNRMKDNCVLLKKAFMSFDKNFDGFIAIEDLQSILCQFTFPMTKQLFNQLMEKCGVRGTGKIGWEDFLEKFQSPMSNGNGQTIPIKPSHKYFPIREGMSPVEANDIWQLLYNHVNNNYASFKHAFLQFDINRKGKVTRTELKNILDKFAIRYQDDQFKELMLKLDPNHTNSISYHKFLELFEETDTAEGHKWLNSVHRVNESKPAIMAWETIEEVLKEKITEYWKNVSSALADYDLKGDGHISHKNLKKVIDNYVLPVSDEHFKSMVSRCEDKTDKQLNYVEFLEMLNVDVRPGDLVGLSTQIFEGSNQREQQRREDLRYRNAKIISAAHERTTEMSAEEVIARLKDRMSQHSHQFRMAFLSYDKRGRGHVSKRDFRQVLGSFGMFMADEQFNILVSKLNFNNKGHMHYTDFIMSFDDPRVMDMGAEIERQGNHRVNPIRGEEFGMTIEQVEEKLAGKLRENFANLRGAFYKFDENHSGSLNKDNFRRLLDAFMCFMSDEQFEGFCKKHGISKKSRISYAEFLDRFELRDSLVEGHKWLTSVHKFNKVQPVPEMAADDAFGILREKAHRNFKDLSQAFIKLDGGSSGLVKRRDLRQLLQLFIMPVPPDEFKKLWKMFDEDNQGYITHQTFLEKIGASEFTPGDCFGTSSKIIDQSKKSLLDHNDTQQTKHERITALQANRAGFMSMDQVEQILRDKIRDNYEHFYEAFRKYDTGKKGSLSVNEVQKVLIDFNLFLDDEQFFALLDKCGLTTNKSRLNYEQFLQAFEEGRKSAYGHRKTDVRIDERPDLSPQEADNKLRELVSPQVEVLERAFGAFDKDNINKILVADFRRVIDLFCFKMTNAQWKFIQQKLHMEVGDKVNYVLFLDNYTMSEQEDAERWLASLQKSIHSQTPMLMGTEEIHDRVRESVNARAYDLAQAFKDADYANLGVISKDDFRTIMNKTMFRVSDEQFDSLWLSLNVNEFGNLDYNDFLKRYTTDTTPPKLPPPTPLQRSATSLGIKRPESMAMRRSVTKLDMVRQGAVSRSQSRMGTPMVDAEGAENVVKSSIFRHWKAIQQQCRQKDVDNSGTINVVDLKEILVKLGVDLGSRDFLDLMTKYDLQENGRFSYVDFLRHFILNLKPQAEPSLLRRRRIHSPKLVRSAGETSTHFFDAMMRLRDTVSQNWKEMRRLFRAVDPSGTGMVNSGEFRSILRQFSVNLTEDEFFHVLSYYDKHMDGQICYNDFIRAYLQHS